MEGVQNPINRRKMDILFILDDMICASWYTSYILKQLLLQIIQIFPVFYDLWLTILIFSPKIL